MLDRARHRLSTVLTGLIYHDGRLTKRIVELARDPMSYFGNLVRTQRALRFLCAVSWQEMNSFYAPCSGERPPSVHLGDHVEALDLHGAAAGDPADDDAAEAVPAAEHRDASHPGATASVCTGQTG